MGEMSKCYGILTSLNPPESIFLDFIYTIPVFATIFEKQEFCQLFSETTWSHINWY